MTVLSSSTITLYGPKGSTSSVQFQPNIYAETLFVQPVISGPGAAFYLPPAPILLSTVKRTYFVIFFVLFSYLFVGDFLITGFTNFLMNPATEQLTVGEEAGPFGITARSVPTGVSLYLTAPGLTV